MCLGSTGDAAAEDTLGPMVVLLVEFVGTMVACLGFGSNLGGGMRGRRECRVKKDQCPIPLDAWELCVRLALMLALSSFGQYVQYLSYSSMKRFRNVRNQ